MNTNTQTQKEIVHKVSSGGFIFYRDTTDSQTFVCLIKHTNGEVWIPKGKLEQGESQTEAAFREIGEEVGFTADQLTYIDLCATDSYSYDMDETHIMNKFLYINVFSVDTKIDPNPTDWKDLDSVDWYTFAEALKIIAYNKAELELAYNIFLNSQN